MRVIVTSRLTLIDKAAVPLGTTVVRLEEFDGHAATPGARCGTSITRHISSTHDIRPFAVPDNGKLLELARQPLLLLMLAIYDSLGNELSGAARHRPDPAVRQAAAPVHRAGTVQGQGRARVRGQLAPPSGRRRSTGRWTGSGSPPSACSAGRT